MYATKTEKRAQRTRGRQAERTRRQGPRRRGTDRSMEQLFDSALGSTRGKERERRLEEVVLTTWAALAAGHPVECPVCGGALTAATGCRSCGSHLD
jgi:hypothetical protein